MQIGSFGIPNFLPNAEAVPAWDVVYTADDLPENSGFPSVHNDSGCIHRDIHAGGFYHYTSTVIGGCYQKAAVWNADANTGFTVEARIKVISSGDLLTRFTGIAVAAGSASTWTGLLVGTTGVWEYGTSWFGAPTFLMDTTDSFHDYRITVQGTTFTIYVDGIARLTGSATIFIEKILWWGDGTAGGGAEALWDCVAYTTTGSFSPTDLPSPSCGTPTCTPPPSGIVSWWDGDAVSGTTAMDIADGNDGTLVNGVTTALGKVGQAFSFDGVDDYLNIGNPSNLNIAGDMTIDFWFRINSQKYNVLAAKGIGLDGNEWWVRQGGPFGGVLEFGFQDTDLDGVIGTSSSPISTGIFYHLALVRDGTTGRLYLNGIQVASDTDPALGDISNPHSIFIGADNRLRNFLPSPFVNDFAAATIDEVEIFNRALSQFEIQSIFNAGSAGKCKAPPSISINDIIVTEGDSGTTDAIFTVLLNNPSSKTITVTFETADGTAALVDGDYFAVTGTLFFIPGDVSKMISVTVNGDSKDEPDEIFFVNLFNCENCMIDDAQGTGTIINDDFPPTADANGPYQGNEGENILLDASGSSDPDNDITTYEWSSGDGQFDDATSIMPNVVFGDNDEFTIGLKVTDSKGLFDTATAEVTVNNVDPVVGAITAPIDPVQVNTPISASALFTDAGFLDTHTAQWDWGDGSMTAGTVMEMDGSGSVTDTHTYTTPGIYTIKLTVIDDDDGMGMSTFQFVVVYDPAGGFVTGGGWIDSPEDAYIADPSLKGKATFGFVSKYKQGATTPTGNTEFQFKVANLNFHSHDYEWLVVAGAKAQYKGVGTINGAGSYGFMLTAIDAGVNANDAHTIDKFRIKIWDKNNGDLLVYDNQLSALDDADPTTEIKGGSIVIHKG